MYFNEYISMNIILENTEKHLVLKYSAARLSSCVLCFVKQCRVKGRKLNTQSNKLQKTESNQNIKIHVQAE